MSKRELRSLLSKLLPYLSGRKQQTALFAVVLLIALSPSVADSPHLHVDPAPIEITVNVPMSASGNVSAYLTTYTSVPRFK
jgi:hypothetical protein